MSYLGWTQPGAVSQASKEMKTTQFDKGILYQGDCLEVMDSMDAESVDVIITSPPYNAQKDYEPDWLSSEEFFDFTEKWLAESYRVLKEGGKAFINIGYWSGSRKDRFFLPMEFIRLGEKVGFKLTSWIPWVKGTLKAPQSNGSGWGDVYGVSPFFQNGDEPILYFVKGKRKRPEGGNNHGNWIQWAKTPWVMPVSHEREHPAAFPPELPYRAMMMTSVEGWTILDPFAGSGSTGVAAVRCNRRYILIERDSAYCDLLIRNVHKEEQRMK